MTNNTFRLSVEQIGKEIVSFTKTSAKRKEHAHQIAMACMLQGAEHRNLTPLTEFAKVLTEAEHSCLRIWAGKYSPASKRKTKDGGFVYKFAEAKEGEQEKPFDLEAMQAENFLDIHVEKEVKDMILGSSNFLNRLEKIIKDIDKALAGEKGTVKEEEKTQVQNLRSMVVGVLQADLDVDTVDLEEDYPQDLAA